MTSTSDSPRYAFLFFPTSPSPSQPSTAGWRAFPLPITVTSAPAFVPGPRPRPHTLLCPPSPLPQRCGQWWGQAREGISEHHMHPSVPHMHDSEASRVSNELMKLPIPAAVLHVATTES